jgi:hypothetical protein
MAISVKSVDLTETEYASELDWAADKGYWMNMLGGIRYDYVRQKYVMAPIKYSDVSLEGEKIRFASGQEFQVIYSCLAAEYKNKQEVKDAWWERAQKVVEDFKEQQKIQAHIDSTNTDLKKLRREGALLDKEDIADGLE